MRWFSLDATLYLARTKSFKSPSPADRQTVLDRHCSHRTKGQTSRSKEDAMERTLTDLSVEGVKTRKKPNKHIVFAVKVIWSDGQVNVVSRRYSEFFELMEKLNEKFPEEAGKNDQNKRILPSLQAKKTFLVSSSVMKQLERITDFTKKLVRLSDYISQCSIVRNFFTPSEADMESFRRISVQKTKTKTKNWRRKMSVKKVMSISGPMSLEHYRVIADVVDGRKKGLELKEGQTVEVIEKLDTGWWLVTAEGEQGWVPASYLSNENDPEETMTTITYEPGQGECYVTNNSYTAKRKDELSFDIGVNVQVIEKNLDGWWRVIYNGCEGMVPSAYLKKVGESKSKKDSNKPPPIRKANILSQRSSVSSQPSDMTVETLTKLRDSTFKSPEEKEERMMLPKVVPTTPPPEQEKTVPQNKGFSLSRKLDYFRKFKQDPNESDTKNSILKIHLPRRSKSSASELKSRKKKSSSSMEESQKVVEPENKLRATKPVPRRKSMVDELLRHDDQDQDHAGKTVRKPTPRKSLDVRAKYQQRWSASEENNFQNLPWKTDDERNDYVLSLQAKSVGVSENDRQTEETSCISTSDSPVFVVTPPPEQIIQSKFPELLPQASKETLHRKKSHSCSDLTSSRPMEDDPFDDREEEEEDDDYYSSDEYICTLEDLLVEERESKGGELYYEDLPNKRKPSRESGSFDSGTASASPPSSPTTVTMPKKNASSNIYVAIADYQGSEEDGEVDLFEGQQVRVLQKTAGGWWLVEDDTKQRGWAPSNYLENPQQLNQSFCYVGDDAVQSSGGLEEVERNTVKLPSGEELEVLDVNNNGHFMLVRVPSKFAWISRAGLIEKDVLPQCKI